MSFTHNGQLGLVVRKEFCFSSPLPRLAPYAVTTTQTPSPTSFENQEAKLTQQSWLPEMELGEMELGAGDKALRFREREEGVL